MINQSEKNILIVGYFFYPENGPRAFRTYELVRELLSRGHCVDLILPNKRIFSEHKFEAENLNVTYLGNPSTVAKNQLSAAFKRESVLRNIARAVYRYFNPFTNTAEYKNLLRDELVKTTKQYDLLISISYPVVCHIGVARAIKRNKLVASVPVKVAEYSDPFYSKNGPRMFFLYRLIDRWAASKFDFITVPTSIAIPAYKKHLPENRISVIPQGFNFDDVVLENYLPNSVPTFAYAGVFYSKIRNPKILFEFLAQAKGKFKFHIFTASANTDSMDIIREYEPILGDRLEVHYNTNRLDLIRHLSTMDFLVNINNLSSFQTPSKLIDYALAKRPVFHFNQENFDQQTFAKFLLGQYNENQFDLEPFNIRNVVDQFLTLKKN